MAESIFLSYRRDGGEHMAQILYDRLTARGYSVFYDIESLKAGAFDRRLLSAIERSDYIIAILPKNALDRCAASKDDWVRQELAHAISLNKIIVPVMLRGFEFPASLPEDIDAIRNEHGIKFEDMSFLDAKIDKLVDIMTSQEKATDQYRKRKSGPALISTVGTIGGKDGNQPFPQDSQYSRIINRDIYPYVYFHAKLRQPASVQKKVKCGYDIFDAEGNLIYEHNSEVAMNVGNDRISMGWCLKGEDGFSVVSGQYTVEVWYDNSKSFEYQFVVTSHEDSLIHKPITGTSRGKAEPQSEVAERIKFLEKKLSKKKGFWLSVLMLLCYCIAISTEIYYIGVIGFIVLMFVLISHIRKHTVRNWFVAFIISTAGIFVYAVVMAIGLLVEGRKHSEWKKELEDLKAIV